MMIMTPVSRSGGCAFGLQAREAIDRVKLPDQSSG
jgi:hypothetical protein